MSRRGFALITALWAVAVLGLLVGVSLRLAGVGAATTRNRVALTRGSWAREACLEILLSRYRAEPAIRLVDTVELGRGTWCRAELEDSGARLDLNGASAEALRILTGNDSLTGALLDWRDADDIPRPLGAEVDWYLNEGRRPPRNGPLRDVSELRYVRGFDDSTAARLAGLLSTVGTKRLNLNSAPPSLLAALPGLGPEVIDVIARRRSAGHRVGGIDQLGALLSPAGRESLLAHYEELAGLVVTEPERYTAVLEGGVRGSASVARAVLTLVPNGTRLAVTRREAR